MTAPLSDGPSPPATPPHQAPSPVLAGLTGRCPRCGKGKLFSGILTVAGRCEACGLDFSKQDSGDGPAVFVIFFLGAIFMPLVLWFEFTYEPPWWLHMVIWTPLAVIVALVLLRLMKGVLVALQLKHHASDSGTVDYSNGDDKEDHR